MESENIPDSWTFQNPYTYTGFSIGSPSVTPPASVGASPTFPEFETFPPFPYQPAITPISEELQISYPYPLTPPPNGSPPETPFCSPRQSVVEPIRTQAAQRQHVTSGRRRAQNRAAQRAFRERKEKHARDLEAKLSELTDKHKSLEASHSELMTAYEKLQKTLELLTSDEGDRGPTSGETLRKLLVLLHGDIKLKPSSTAPVKTEDEVGPKDDDGAT